MGTARGPDAAAGTFATNRKARRDYEILESHEAGIELVGPEVKSIRQHRVSLDDSFARIEGADLLLYNMYVSPYAQAGRENVEPRRTRRLLLHRRQIDHLAGLLAQRRLALVPLRLYPRHGLIKVELAVGRGKRAFEKRDRIREREVDREIRRALRKDQPRR
jgi:SsrA-binding protein